jgi:hypothetical protein
MTTEAVFRRRAVRKKATIGRLEGVLACFTGWGRSDGEAKILAASAWRQVHCNGGASSTMERWSSALFLDRELAEKGDQEEEGWRRKGRKRARV